MMAFKVGFLIADAAMERKKKNDQLWLGCVQAKVQRIFSK
jgi:hypothetical protein